MPNRSPRPRIRPAEAPPVPTRFLTAVSRSTPSPSNLGRLASCVRSPLKIARAPAFMRVAFMRVAFMRVASMRVASMRVASMRVASMRVASMRVASMRVALMCATMAATLAGCASAPPPAAAPPPPTVVNVTMNTAADANPGPEGRGAPVALRLYQLTTPANFNNADFVPIWKDDAATLKSDMVRREDFLLAPGLSTPDQAKTDTIKPDDPVKSLGVFAAYRDFRHANWRGAVDIPPHRTTNITVTAGRDGVVVKAETLPLPPPPPPPKSGS